MNPSSDLQAHPVPRVLCVGDITADIMANPVRQLPCPGEVRMTDRIAFFPGGNALNTALALQRLGERASFCGSLGDDPIGDLLLSELGKTGLNLTGVRREPHCSTPTTLILRIEGEDRRFLHDPGAGNRFTGTEVPVGLIPEGGVLLAAGYLKLRSWQDAAFEQLCHEAHRRHCTTLLNVCIPSDGGIEPSRCLRLLPLVDVFVPNEDEARLLTGETRPIDQARRLIEAGTRWVVITRGVRGLLAADAAGTVEFGAYSVPLVDPSGCGDCFTAGLIAGLLRKWDQERTLTFASALGALGATTMGCTSGVPPFGEVERFIAGRPGLGGKPTSHQ